MCILPSLIDEMFGHIIYNFLKNLLVKIKIRVSTDGVGIWKATKKNFGEECKEDNLPVRTHVKIFLAIGAIKIVENKIIEKQFNGSLTL